ncbi:tetratricopeptide repeat protein 5 [Exaiptasia diaphana]|uniref:Tetratricopeptide repeat protein 5 OB fold domain-containing protein n=1 Tax=Exaiptasia diaphana TaxID=2652724 RepID=A0A913WU06_EXADI|nr:tetratricopeptide repeat protein 5 [Exaiptasia diaphana]KXJ17877.1 Tetratricopeptide repeat protein 5 [Exaiptasia diaphana]
MEDEEKPRSDDVNIEEAERKVQELYNFRDTYFETHGIEQACDKNSLVEEKMKEILSILDYIHASAEDTARCLYLRGKALNIKPEFDQAAQDALSKAVKLVPKMVEAWNALGECYWKKGDMAAAKNCFSGALSHSRNKDSLRNLSMVLRQLGGDISEKGENIQRSVSMAKEAVSLDISDGMSWYILGNAYLSQFFNGTQSPQVLKQCMSAYSQAENDPRTASNPDLHFNRAMAYKYQEEYGKCIQDLKKAVMFDPGFTECNEQKNKLLRYLMHTLELVRGKGKLKPKRLQSLVQSQGESELGPYAGGCYTSPKGVSVKLEQVSVSQLVGGINDGKVVLGRMVGSVPMDDPLPYTFAMVDSQGICLPVTVYNMNMTSGFMVGDSVAIPEPFLQVTDFTEDDKTFKFESIRVDSPVVLVVNKKKLGKSQLAPSVLSVTAKKE